MVAVRDISYLRQLDLVPQEKLREARVHIIGAGGIGSPTALALAKMGVGKLVLWDDDKVEGHNLPNQFHRLADLELETYKVHALSALIGEFVGKEVEVTTLPMRFTPEDGKGLAGIVIMAVDSMTERIAIWGALKGNPKVDCLIDARLGAHLLRAYTVRPHDRFEAADYEETLYTSEQALQLPCTGRATIYTGLLAATIVCNQLRRHLAGSQRIFEVVFDLDSYILLTK